MTDNLSEVAPGVNEMQPTRPSVLPNIAGAEGVPSPKLVSDLRKLMGLPREQLEGLAAVYGAITTEKLEEDDFDTVLLQEARSVELDLEELLLCLRVSAFVMKRWAAQDLTKEQILQDIRSLGVPEEQQRNVELLIDAIAEKVPLLRAEGAAGIVLGTGTPRVDSAACVIDARAVFKSARYDPHEEVSQPYFVIDRFVPVAVLELVGQLNDEKTNHSFLLTERTLRQLHDILARALKRMRAVATAVERMSYGPGQEHPKETP